jgi:hypothetical protein
MLLDHAGRVPGTFCNHRDVQAIRPVEQEYPPGFRWQCVDRSAVLIGPGHPDRQSGVCRGRRLAEDAGAECPKPSNEEPKGKLRHIEFR